jgi:hypothetical protein
MKQKIIDTDPNLDRSTQIHKMWIKHSASTSVCMYEDLKKEETVQSAVLKYFERQ